MRMQCGYPQLVTHTQKILPRTNREFQQQQKITANQKYNTLSWPAALKDVGNPRVNCRYLGEIRQTRRTESRKRSGTQEKELA